jgi:sugar phosphate isomerase/epimerase
MAKLRDLEIGVMFWGGRDPVETIREVKALGVRCGQIGVPGNMPVDDAAAAQWNEALATEDFAIVTVFCAYNGEDYADGPTVQRTVGFIPRATRQEREARTIEVSEFARRIGAPAIACHVGFVPEDRNDADYQAVREMVRRICDHAARNGQTFALETGQEPANVLLEFFKDVDRPNLRINFDPANMILYGTGDPIEAIGILGSHVESVHAKDGDWPPKDVDGALGTEKPLGQGSVNIERFIRKLKEIGREDVAQAVKLLERLRG